MHDARIDDPISFGTYQCRAWYHQFELQQSRLHPFITSMTAHLLATRSSPEFLSYKAESSWGSIAMNKILCTMLPGGHSLELL